jgi:hypothetical protein
MSSRGNDLNTILKKLTIDTLVETPKQEEKKRKKFKLR